MALALAGAAVLADTPARVVSINLCTDQLALMVAAPGQVISVSKMGQDARSSAMAEAAAGLPPNTARAEEVFAMQPDLVLGGSYSSAGSVAMMRRLGMRVELFEPASSLEDIRANVLKMGALLGREDAALAVVARFDADLAGLQDGGPRPRAALYFANGYTTGEATLAGQIAKAAGFDNVAREAGYPAGGFMPLEQLVVMAPDVVITGQAYRGASRAEAVMDHPVVRHLKGRAAFGAVTDRNWVCGTPGVIRAIAALRALRLGLEGGS